ncbi:hypothetical protein DW639_10800 [Megamonas funiformis]|uniref:hypothetical protein n=1 Tax=Megamonas funiformis TaxID=437897 RepID=UPI000E496D55|nr:hypothetical protein [Megamonas funiformis]RHG04578.1 hypothetical protein DW639_10800 [Megamonas funiformis]
MDKDYLIQFNTDGTRLNTYANGVHYSYTPAHEEYETVFEDGEQKEVYAGFVDEEILNLVDGFDYQSVLDNGGVWFNQDDYNKLVGNADKEYIYKDCQIVEKPAYVPTAEELQEQARQALDAEYAVKFADKDNEIIKAVLIMQDTEYAQQLRQERTALVQEYADKRSAL